MATLERSGESRERQILDLDLTAPAGRSTRLRTGDLLPLGAVSPSFTNGVSVAGHVYRPVSVGWRQGLRLTDVLRSPQDRKPDADLSYVVIRRESQDRKVSVVSANLLNAWRQPASADDVLLAPRDQILVFNLEGGRDLVLKPVLEDLRRQAQAGQPTQIVGVGGPRQDAGTVPPGARDDRLRPGASRRRALFYDEKRRRCRTCNKVQFWDLSVSDVIEQFTGEPNQGQWSSIEYSPYEKKN